MRFEKKETDKCLLKFVTEGVLLRDIEKDPLLKNYSIVILDEAHERGLNCDFL